MNKDVKGKVEACSACLQYRSGQVPGPLKSRPIPSGPWGKAAADLCEIGNRHYLVVIDYYSTLPDVYQLKQQPSTSVTQALKRCFARMGIPYEVFTDNSSCFASQSFAEFAETWNFKHRTSNPLYPQSNCMVE